MIQGTLQSCDLLLARPRDGIEEPPAEHRIVTFRERFQGTRPHQTFVENNMQQCEQQENVRAGDQ